MNRILAILIVTILAAGSGGLAGSRLFQLVSGSVEPEKKEAKPEKTADIASNVRELRPIITNLSAPAGAWVRLEAAIVMEPQGPHEMDHLALEISTDILAYLQTLTISDIQGPDGLRQLREDLNERAIIRSSKKVSELVIETLVIQ